MKVKFKVLLIIVVLIITIYSLPIYGNDNIHWTKNYNMASDSLSDIAYGNGVFVTIGDDGTIKTSLDGSDWQKRESNTNKTFQSIEWNGSRFVAVGRGIISTSLDGFIWTIVQEFNESLMNLHWTGKKFIARGDNGLIYTSEDGLNWSKKAVDSEAHLMAFSSNESKTIMTADYGIIFVSSDGVEWEKIKTGFEDARLNESIWFEGKFYVYGTNGIILTSSDAISWSITRNEGLSTVSDIIQYNDYLLGLGFDGVYISTDAITWEKIVYSKYNLYSIASDDKNIVIVGELGTIITSDNLLEWDVKSNIITNKILNSIEWNGSKFIVAGNYAGFGTIIDSQDGLNWADSMNGNLAENLTNISWIKDRFIGTGYKKLLTSFDGANWIDAANPTYTLTSVANNESIIVAVGWKGEIYTSTDAVNWDIVQKVTNLNIHKVIWGGNNFVAVGEYGLIITSPDGKNWTNQTTGIVEGLNGVAWNGQNYMAVGDGGTILISSNSIKWTKVISNSTRILKDLIWDGSRFVIVGSGQVLLSEDGERITDCYISTEHLLYDIAWNGEYYVAVGDQGTIMTANPIDIIKVKVNNKPLVFDTVPINKNGRVMVPLRSVFQALGAEVYWEQDTQNIKGVKDSIVIILKIDDNKATVNDKIINLDVAPMIVNQRTYVPTRFIAESLGAQVIWDNNSSTVIIN